MSHLRLLLVLLLAGCASSGASVAPQPGSNPPVPRWSGDKRAIYAAEEIAEQARVLEKLVGARVSAGSPRVAFWYFRDEAQAESFVGESFAQDFASEIVSRGRVEVYARRGLTRVAEQELRQQASSIFDSSTLAEVGRRQGVHAIVVGTVDGRSPGTIQIIWQLIDTSNGQILGGKRLALDAHRATRTQPIEGRMDAPVAIAEALLPGISGSDQRVAPYYFLQNKRRIDAGAVLARDVALEMANVSTDISFFSRESILSDVESQAAVEDDAMFDERSVTALKVKGVNLVLTGWMEYYPNFIKVNSQVVDVETWRVVSARVHLMQRR